MWHGGMDEGAGNGLSMCENRGFGFGMHVALGFGPGRCCFGAGGQIGMNWPCVPLFASTSCLRPL